MFSGWSRSDALSAASLVVGIIGLMVVVLQLLPSILPEVAMVTRISYTQMSGLAQAVTTFRNVSYDTPINDLHAEWRLDRDEVASAVDFAGLNIQTPERNRRTLRSTKPIPAQAEFRTIFNSPQPFLVSDFSAKATRLIVSPSGAVSADVPIIEEQTYNKLLARRYAAAAATLVGYLVVYLLLMWATKKLFLSPLSPEAKNAK